MHYAEANSSISREIWDSSGQARLYSTTRFETKIGAAGEMKRLTGFSGGIDAPGSGNSVGSGVTITSNSINYGYYGYLEDGRYVSMPLILNLGNSTRSYNYNWTSDWVYSPTGLVGHTYTVGLTRGNSWYVELSNNA